MVLANGRRTWWVVLALPCLMASNEVCWSQVTKPLTDPPQTQTKPETDRGNDVAATVGGDPILWREVDRELKKALANRQIEDKARAVLRSTMREQLIDRRLILRHLRQRNTGASRVELQLAVRQIEKQLAEKNQRLEDYLAKENMNRHELESLLAWRIGWPRFLSGYLTEANVKKYFARNQRDFDGTQLRVAHILLKEESSRGEVERASKTPSQPNASQPSATYTNAVKHATRLRGQILNGSLSFADAAKKYSQAPSGAKGGAQGWIRRHEPMPARFNQAAFALKAGQISPPVTSRFGVHLIQCLEVKPGTRTWQKAEKEVRTAMSKFLFRWLADKSRPGVEIKRR